MVLLFEMKHHWGLVVAKTIRLRFFRSASPIQSFIHFPNDPWFHPKCNDMDKIGFLGCSRIFCLLQPSKLFWMRLPKVKQRHLGEAPWRHNIISKQALTVFWMLWHTLYRFDLSPVGVLLIFWAGMWSRCFWCYEIFAIIIRYME